MHSRKKQQNKPREDKQRSAVDAPFLIIVLILVVFGLIMLFSASYATALYRFGDSFHFIKDQVLFAVVGVTAMFIASRVDYHIFHRLAWPLMVVSLLLLVVVLFMPALNNAHRWIQIPGLGTLQPSEIAKFAVIVLFAHIISINYAKMKTFSYGVIPFMVVLVPIIVLMILEPHLSGTILIFGIGCIMMYIGGTKLRYFLAVGGLSVGAIAGIVAFKGVSYITERLQFWLNPFADINDKTWQTVQSLVAIGSGGLLGRGIGASRQKYLYLPEPYNDFIFAIICEELGLIGALFVIVLFVLFAVRGFSIASKAPDRFGFMLATGITVQICLQAALNIAVVTNTIPNTGISLPFFSYGGTAIMMQLGEMGILLNISRHAFMEKT